MCLGGILAGSAARADGQVQRQPLGQTLDPRFVAVRQARGARAANGVEERFIHTWPAINSAAKIARGAIAPWVDDE